MPPKLTISDYTFYFVPSIHGKYLFGLENPKRGDVFRKTRSEFNAMIQKVRDLDHENSFVILFAISNICNVATGEYTLVYDIFEDLRDEEEEDACCWN